MMMSYKYLCLLTLVLSCSTPLKKTVKTPIEKGFKTVEITDIVADSLLNVRALEVLKDQNAFVFLTSKGQMGVYAPQYGELKYPIEVDSSKVKPNFRALSARNSSGYGISIGNPAKLYKLDSSKPNTIVYKEEHENVFYDAMSFWNDQEGIAIGDPTEDCMSIIITRDAGNSWTKLPCSQLPKANKGEAAFAASDTNIAIVGDKTWVATGGKSSRILYSADKGNTWVVYKTPIVQGLETTGMYSIDFYDELNGFAIGGDYTKPDHNNANKMRTENGGKTWQLVAENKNPGYRSCVQYVPNSKAKGLVAVGFKGVDYSNDAGNTWRHLSDASFYTIRFLNDSIAFAGGNGRVSKLKFK